MVRIACRFFGLGLVVTIALTGCQQAAQQQSIVGRWQVTGVKGLPNGSTYMIEFKEDKSFNVVITMVGRYTNHPEMGTIVMNVVGDYALADGTYTINPTECKLDLAAVADPRARTISESELTTWQNNIMENVRSNGPIKPMWREDIEFASENSSGTKLTYVRATN